MTELFQAPVDITKIETTPDKCLKITMHTAQELPSAHEALLMSLRRKTGWMLFKEVQIEEQDIANLPDFVPDFKNEKSPSQRLRAVLYRQWEQSAMKEAFETYYRSAMDRILEHEKAKLEP